MTAAMPPPRTWPISWPRRCTSLSPVREIEDAGRKQRVVFAETVTGDPRRRRRAVFVPRAERHRVDDEQRRLRELR